MTSRTRRRFRVTLLALCCLLLAQWTLASHACPVIRQAGERMAQLNAEAEQRAALENAVAHDCHGAMRADAAKPASDRPAQSPTCLKHCADEGSTSGTAGLGSAAAGAAPPLVLRAALPAPAGPVAWQRAPARSDATAPPLSILYCVFLS
jgi:hypothetical protein